MKKIVYLANPYGFSAQQKTLLLPQLVAALEDLGLEVWEPFRPEQPGRYCGGGLGVQDRAGRLPGRCGVGWDICGGQRSSTGRGGDGGTGDGDCFEEAYLFVPGRLPERERQWRISPKFDVVHRNPARRVAGLLLHVDRRDRVAGEGPSSVGAKLKMEAFE